MRFVVGLGRTVQANTPRYLARRPYSTDSDQNRESAVINPAGLSSCTLCPASGTAVHAPLAKRAAKRAAASLEKTSLRPPRTTRQRQRRRSAATAISSTLASSAG